MWPKLPFTCSTARSCIGIRPSERIGPERCKQVVVMVHGSGNECDRLRNMSKLTSRASRNGKT
jgi:hypothetical protein